MRNIHLNQKKKEKRKKEEATSKGQHLGGRKKRK